MRALIVDDSNFIREHLRQQLQVLGMDCTEAVNGRDALDVLGEARFDLMLVDVNMPVMHGLECVRRVGPAKGPMKVVMVTTEADNSIIEQALEYGADEFLMKPFSPQSLREKLALLGF